MHALADFIHHAITIYIYLLIAAALMSWLVAFRVFNTQNRLVYAILGFLFKVTEPALRPVRRIVPDLGGIDVSPIILILLLYFIRDLIVDYIV